MHWGSTELSDNHWHFAQTLILSDECVLNTSITGFRHHIILSTPIVNVQHHIIDSVVIIKKTILATENGDSKTQYLCEMKYRKGRLINKIFALIYLTKWYNYSNLNNFNHFVFSIGQLLKGSHRINVISMMNIQPFFNVSLA